MPAVVNELREALTNLVFNAVDALTEGGDIRIRTRLIDTEPGQLQRVRLEVIDTGAEMEEATRRRCMEPFFTTKGERGTGLGLAMVFAVAARHHGSLEIDSAPGKGTTMQLEFASASGFRRQRQKRSRSTNCDYCGFCRSTTIPLS